MVVTHARIPSWLRHPRMGLQAAEELVMLYDLLYVIGTVLIVLGVLSFFLNESHP